MRFFFSSFRETHIWLLFRLKKISGPLPLGSPLQIYLLIIILLILCVDTDTILLILILCVILLKLLHRCQYYSIIPESHQRWTCFQRKNLFNKTYHKENQICTSKKENRFPYLFFPVRIYKSSIALWNN